MSNRKIISFEEGWKTLQKGITKAQNIAEGLPEPKFTIEENMALYTTGYNLCFQGFPHNHGRELYGKYKETCEEYIISKVLPSLGGRKNDLLLRELLRRWSNYKVMTKLLSKFFRYFNEHKIPCPSPITFPSLEETSFLAFNHMVYEEMNEEITNAIFVVIDQKLSGEKIDQTFLINTLDFYIKFYKGSKMDKEKEKKVNFSADNLSKKINLISSDVVVFEIDYGVALMSHRFADITETISAGDVVDAISVHKMSSKMLEMVLEYCKKVKRNSGLTDSELRDWLAQFVNVDPKTLLDLLTAACYMKVDSLVKLTWSKVDGMIKDKTPEEISEIFGAVDDSNSKLLEENNE